MARVTNTKLGVSCSVKSSVKAAQTTCLVHGVFVGTQKEIKDSVKHLAAALSDLFGLLFMDNLSK